MDSETELRELIMKHLPKKYQEEALKLLRMAISETVSDSLQYEES